MDEDYPLRSSNYMTPLLLGSENYNWWKGRMKLHLTKKPLKLRVVQKGPYEFVDDNDKPKDIDDLTHDELLKVSYNNKAKNMIMTGLSPFETDKVSSCNTANEM